MSGRRYHARSGPPVPAIHRQPIPWYVRAIWLGFWVFAVYYTARYLFPDLQVELLSPP